jgi:hypothetical protein
MTAPRLLILALTIRQFIAISGCGVSEGEVAMNLASTRVAVGAFALSAATAASGAVASAQTFTDRDSVYVITFPSGLDSATTQYTVTMTLPPGGSDSLNTTLNFKSSWPNVFFANTGTVTNTYTTAIPPGTGSEIGNILNGGSGGTFQWGLHDTERTRLHIELDGVDRRSGG